VDAGRTLLVDGDDVLATANAAGIAIVGRPTDRQPARTGRGGAANGG
jgi:hypothetical protein